MANTFQRSDGDIAQVMQTMLASPEFAQAQPRKFKDPNRFRCRRCEWRMRINR